MKRIGLILVMSCLFTSISSGQTLIEQIEHAYSTLDSTSYIDNVIQSYERSLEKMDKEAYELLIYLSCSGNDSINHIQGCNRADSMYLAMLPENRISHANYVKQFKNEVKFGTPLYVLNLRLKDGHTLQVDTGRLAFNLFSFGKRCKGRLYVYCDEGEYSWQDSHYITFSRKLGINAPKVFRKIMRKHPKYLLYCPDLEGMNTILYLIDNDIYVYRIVEMQEYKLDDYMKNRTSFMNS